MDSHADIKNSVQTKFIHTSTALGSMSVECLLLHKMEMIQCSTNPNRSMKRHPIRRC